MAKHPRLLFGPDDIERLRAFAASPEGKPFMNIMKTYLPACRVPDKHAFLTDATDGQRQGYWNMPTAALHYVLTGEKASLDHALGFMKMLLSLEQWETSSERDSGMSAANLMVGAALCYDWLYDELDPEFREQFRQKLLLHARKMYYGGHLCKNPGTHYWQGDPANNHRWHRNAGLTLATLAAYTGAPEEQWILNEVFNELNYIVKWLPQDGTCHEGPGYSIFGTSHLVVAMSASDRCFGTQHLENPFFKNIGRFLTQSLTPDRNQMIPFGDDGGGRLGSYACFLYKTAAVHKQQDVYVLMDSAVDSHPRQFNVTTWMPLIWYDPKLAHGKLTDLPTRAFFDDLDLAFIRDGWTNTSAAAMFKCGPFGGRTLNAFRNSNNFKYINVAHDDPDANAFILWKNGGFLAETDRYSKHKKSSHFNTILINGMGQMVQGHPEDVVWTQPAPGNVDMTEMAFITAYKDTPTVVIIEGEASGSYLAYTNRDTGISRPALKRYRRTFIWVQGKYVLVLDDIRADKPVDITWLMQGPKLQAVNAEQGTYRLSRDEQACPFRVISTQPMTGQIKTSEADHRGKPLGWQQLQLEANSNALRVVSVYDLWNVGSLDIELKADNADQATVVVSGPDLRDTWTWQAAPNTKTASNITGKRDGKTIAGITAADTSANIASGN